MAMTRRGVPAPSASAGASASKSSTVRVRPGRQTTGSPGAARAPYSRTCSFKPSWAATNVLRPGSRVPGLSAGIVLLAAAAQVGFDPQLRTVVEADPIDLHVLDYALHVVARLLQRN